MMPAPRCTLPLMVDAFQRLPRGGGIPSRLSVAAISRGVSPLVYEAKMRWTTLASCSTISSLSCPARRAICATAWLSPISRNSGHIATHLLGRILKLELSHETQAAEVLRLYP